MLCPYSLDGARALVTLPRPHLEVVENVYFASLG